MNKNDIFDVLNLKYSCRACLRTSADVLPMTLSERNVYLTFAAKALKMELDMNICTICRWVLNKFIKFTNQCQKANEILNQIVKQSKISYQQRLTTSHNIGQTTPVIHYVGPDSNLSDDKNMIMWMDDDHYIDDDDEIPLVRLKEEDGYWKKNKFEIEMIPSNAIIMRSEQEETTQANCHFKPKRKKKNKELPEGFSSRMVQETDEYVVIKLTKEQVLQEISERANSDAYTRSPFKCKHCAKGFNFDEVLAAHMLKHSLEHGSYKCEMCAQYCPTPVSLRGHIKSHTTRYKCKICGQVRLSRQHLLEHHANTHTSAPAEYTCDKCNFKTNKRTVMQRHVKCHSESERHTCHRCGKLFSSVESLRVHTARHNVESRLRCGQCDKQFIYPSLLHKHIQAVHEREEYYCVECDIKFKSRDTLRMHFRKARRHRNPSSYKYQCPHCDQRFLSTSSLAGHLSCAHGAPKSHACDTCGKRYGSRAALRGHHRRAHSKGDVECPRCHKTFARKSLLKTHGGECGAISGHIQKQDELISRIEGTPQEVC